MSWGEASFSCSVFVFIVFEFFVAAIWGIPEFTSLENVTQYLGNLSLDATGLEETSSILQETIFPRLPILNLIMGFLVVFLMYVGEKLKTQYHFVAVHLLLKIMSISIMISSIFYWKQFMLSGVRYVIYCSLIGFSNFPFVYSRDIKIYHFRVSSNILSTIKLLGHYLFFSVNVAAVLNSQELETGYINSVLACFIVYLSLLTILHLITTVCMIITNPQQRQKMFVIFHLMFGFLMLLVLVAIFGVIVYNKIVLPQKKIEHSTAFLSVSIIVLLFDSALLIIFIYSLSMNEKNTDHHYTKVKDSEEEDNLLSQDITKESDC